MNRKMFGELISEAIAMFIIIALGESAAAMYILYDPSPYQNAYWGLCICWGLAVTIAIYVTASVFRNPCQSGRYLGTGALPRLPLEKSIAVLGSTSHRRLHRCNDCVPAL